MIRTKCVSGLNVVRSSLSSAKQCLDCMRGKFSRSPFPPDHTQVQPLSHLHIDASGPYPSSIDGDRYFLTCRDKATGYTLITTSPNKSGSKFVQECIEFLERQSPYTVKHIRTDQGREFLNESLESYLKNKGIFHQVTAIDSSTTNGVAERVNRTLWTG